jgi:hypothetical protein
MGVHVRQRPARPDTLFAEVTMKTIRRGVLLLVLPLLLGGLSTPLGAQEPAITVEGVIAQGVVDRMPVDTGSTFAADVGTLWCWTKVTGAAGMTLEHVWRFAGYEWVVPLQIGGSPWRTYSSKKIVPEWKGEWTVSVRDAAGNVLQTMTFMIE